MNSSGEVARRHRIPERRWPSLARMDFAIPADIASLLDDLDTFIADEIKPLERENDNIRFFDHRREDARTDWDRNGWPNAEWEALLGEMRRRADAAGFLRLSLIHIPSPRDQRGSRMPSSA